MSSASGEQNYCVYIGNIPFDATEEEMIQICEQIGPVVYFRLIIDPTSRRSKGYGFCKYKDEETALSACRNLEGHVINGRGLHLRMANKDKGADMTSEQVWGGPGLIAGNAALHAPLGFPLAAAAASAMTEVFCVLPPVSGFENDPLTLYLSKMSRNRLCNIMLELKDLATRNETMVQKLLQGNPQLCKALFQAQIMLGMVELKKVCNINRTINSMQMQLASPRKSSIAAEPSQLGQLLPAEEFSEEQRSVLLQQVMRLTPEQLSSLSVEQQQQVLQIQQLGSLPLVQQQQQQLPDLQQVFGQKPPQ